MSATPFGALHSLCPECAQDVYPGIHGTGCSRGSDDQAGIPVALRNQVLPPPTEPCEWCRLNTPSTEFWAQLGRKPVGQPCEVCGNDAPRGTYPLRGAYTGRVWDREPEVLCKDHQPPRAPQWRTEAA